MAAPKPPPLRIDEEQEAALIKKYGMKPKLSPRLLAKVGRAGLSQASLLPKHKTYKTQSILERSQRHLACGCHAELCLATCFLSVHPP